MVNKLKHIVPLELCVFAIHLSLGMLKISPFFV